MHDTPMLYVETSIMTEPTTSPIESAAPETEKPATTLSVGNDRIRIRAYELYEKRKDQLGDAESDWYRAEAEINAEIVTR
ncbi:MAG: DUF2934 domain-containing protein [Thermoanaerobaculia bacterium]